MEIILVTLKERFYNFSPGKQIGLLRIDGDGDEIIKTYSIQNRYIDNWYSELPNQYINLFKVKIK